MSLHINSMESDARFDAFKIIIESFSLGYLISAIYFSGMLLVTSIPIPANIIIKAIFIGGMPIVGIDYKFMAEKEFLTGKKLAQLHQELIFKHAATQLKLQLYYWHKYLLFTHAPKAITFDINKNQTHRFHTTSI
jgi:hypothetical protein